MNNSGNFAFFIDYLGLHEGNMNGPSGVTHNLGGVFGETNGIGAIKKIV